MKNIRTEGRMIQPSEMYMVREPDNTYDSNCVQVRYRHGGLDVKIGNVNKENAPAIASCMDAGGTAEIKSCSLCGSPDTNIGLYFVVNTIS